MFPGLSAGTLNAGIRMEITEATVCRAGTTEDTQVLKGNWGGGK